MLLWRNKVAAHFALADPRMDDNPADLAASVMFPIGFLDDAFSTRPFRLSITAKGTSSVSREGMEWSLTKIHGDLSKRYGWL